MGLQGASQQDHQIKVRRGASKPSAVRYVNCPDVSAQKAHNFESCVVSTQHEPINCRRLCCLYISMLRWLLVVTKQRTPTAGVVVLARRQCANQS